MKQKKNRHTFLHFFFLLTLPFFGLYFFPQLHEEHELVWSDGVAPETAIDFDAPHLSPLAGLGYWLGGLGFFYGVYLFAYSVNHPANNPAAKRELPDEAIELATAGYVKNASATAV